MRNSRNRFQANKQAPWRDQIQLIVVILAAVAIFGLLAALYLDVTARAATAGRQVQDLQHSREELEQDIEDMQTELAYLQSVSVMGKRAEKLNFEVISLGNITFVAVPGYESRNDFQLAPSPGSLFEGGQRLPEIYTQSLFEWFGGIFSLGGL